MATSITADQVAEYLGIPMPTEPGDLLVLTTATNAVNTLIPATVPRVRALPAGTDWPDDVLNAAYLQAARFWTRRRSPTGIATYTETGAVFTPRWDPDVEKLLHIGDWAPPGFA